MPSVLLVHDDYSRSKGIMKRGIYETEYGNTAYVSGPKARTAWDMDMGEGGY